jgi:UDP-GlcNAc:undecaprenyl-phosphate/decaprenyl-phosphate GlcNAc-1-phosphate transferase
MLAHLAVAATAAVAPVMATPPGARLARRAGAVELPTGASDDARRVPTLGGLGMLAGLLVALGLAWLLPTFDPLFASTSEPLALVAGAVVIVVIGVVDDVLELPPTVKLAGQIVAALVVALLGIQLVHFWIPGIEIVALSSDLGMPLTILALVAMINAVNLIDGLDGLAAGITAIAAVAFFVFATMTGPSGLADTIPTSATLVAAIVAGMSLGFLVFNWHPARVFMGDTGSMLLGLLLGAAGVAYVGRTTAPSSADFFRTVPLIVPALVLAVPFLDTVFAVVRRVARRRPIAVGDRGHIHHLLLRAGHTHRRAVVTLYYWSAVLAVGSVGPVFVPFLQLLPWLVGAVSLGIVLTILGARVPEEPSERTARRDSA